MEKNHINVENSAVRQAALFCFLQGGMDMQKRCLRLGAAMILLAVALRLLSNGIGGRVSAFLENADAASFLLYLHSGRVIHAPEPTQPVETEPPSTAPEETEPTLPAFSASDTRLVDMSYHSGYTPDLEALLCSGLHWELTGEAPAVLIYHSHATESFTPAPGEHYTEASAYRTLDTGYNMVSIGAYLAELLEERGIRVIHDRGLHDEPDYNGSYASSRRSVQAYLEQYPSIRLVIDLHRDASSTDSPQQLDTHALVNGKDAGQLMMVVGTDDGGLFHPNWQENLALALKLHVVLEKLYPGIMRPVSFRTQRFNQDLSAGAVLIEVGAAGDSHAEALTAAEALAEAIAVLAKGTQ